MRRGHNFETRRSLNIFVHRRVFVSYVKAQELSRFVDVNSNKQLMRKYKLKVLMHAMINS